VLGSGSNPGTGIAALRMTTGSVEAGRDDAIGSGSTLGTGTALGSAAAVGSGAAVSDGSAVVRGTTEGTVTGIVGSASVEGIAGSVGTGATTGTSVAAVSGVRGEAVHATAAISAKSTSKRTPFLPTSRQSKSPASRPRPRRKQVVFAVQSASGRLTAWEARL
jgi:hypothetical protein